MKLDDVKKLQQKKYRNEFGHFLVEGEHLVLELEKAAAQNQALHASEIFVTEHYKNWDSSFKKTVINEKQMMQISDTKTPQGIIAVAPFFSAISEPINKGLTKNERAIYLHEIQDPGNLGTILRTLAWFGGFRCLLSPGSVDPHNPKVVRSSMGAIFYVPIELEVPLETLQQRFSEIACMDLNGAGITNASFKNFSCYMFGNEARGIPHELLADLNAEKFSIAGSGTIDSLNLASAVNISVYELMR